MSDNAKCAEAGLGKPVQVVTKGSNAWAAIRAEFIEAQAGQCAICRQDVTEDPRLDHCHETGCIRGVLCSSCNVKLGWYEGRRREIEQYLAGAYEFEAHRMADRMTRPERWRKYWQGKQIA